MNGYKLSSEELDREIKQILERGLTKPKNLWQYLIELHRALGLRYLFFKTSSTWVMTILLTLLLLMLWPTWSEDYLYAALFAVSPICFLIIVLLTEAIEKLSGLYELKMTLTYTVRQLVVVRILYFSFIGSMFSIIMSFYFSHYLITMEEFPKLLSLSLSALFLCAFVSAFTMRHFHSYWSQICSLVYWFLFGLLPYVWFGTQWNAFLKQLPLALTVVIAILVLMLLLHEIKKNLILYTSEVI